MQMRAKGPGAGWSWLMRGFTVAGRDPGKILGASVILVLCLSLPTVIQLVAKPRGAAAIIFLGATMLVMAIVYPVLMGGFMRLLDASRNARPVHVLTVFEPFQPGQGGSRLVLFGLCMMLLYVAFLLVLLITVGHGMGSWYLQLLNQQALGTPAHALPPLPAGFSLTLALLTVFLLFYGGAMAIGIGQVALRGQPPLSAFRDGVAGAFKNALPLLVLAVCGLLALFALALVLGVIVAILVLLGGLVSTVLGIALAGVVYVAMLLLMYAYVMGVNYAVWDDVANDGQNDLSVRTSMPSADA